MFRLRLFVLAVAFAILGLAAPSFAQFNASIEGTITDPSGAVIAGAKVTATEVGTGFTRSANTSADGF